MRFFTKILATLKNNKGMSLVECIAAIAIIAISASMLAMGFMASAVNLDRTAKIQEQSLKMSSAIELDVNNGSLGRESNITFHISDKEDFSVSGKIIRESDKDSGITYTIFKAND